MTTKLTLTIEEEVIRDAKIYAQEKGRSLSDLIESYLKTLTSKKRPDKFLSPKVKKLKGVVKLPQDYDYKTSLQKGIEKKYGQ